MNAALLVYTARRIALMLPTFVVITFIGFAIMHLAPGDPVELALTGGLASGQAGISTQKMADVQKAKAELRHELGLDRPIPVQYVDWLASFVRGDLGHSLKDRQPVWDKIRERLPITVVINLIGLLSAYLVAVPLGVYSAVRPGTRLDQYSTVVIFMLYAVPSFWLCVMLIVFFAAATTSPGSRRRSALAALLRGLVVWRRAGDVLPPSGVAALRHDAGGYTELSRYLRSSLLENARQDFIRTARAKGVPERSVILKQMGRNSLIPMVMIFGGILPSMISGSVIIENMFSIPGLGQLGYQAVLSRDYPVVLALFGSTSGLSLLGFLVSDLLLPLVDPRISFGRTAA
jgi:peptide/nickel transport system permease protein